MNTLRTLVVLGLFSVSWHLASAPATNPLPTLPPHYIVNFGDGTAAVCPRTEWELGVLYECIYGHLTQKPDGGQALIPLEPAYCFVAKMDSPEQPYFGCGPSYMREELQWEADKAKAKYSI